MRSTIRGLMVPLAALGVGACDDLGPQSEAPLTVSFAVEPRAGLAGSVAGLSLATAAETVTLDGVELYLEELVLERQEAGGHVDSDGDSDLDSDSDHGGNEKFAVEGAIIDLPLDGSVVTPLNQTVPAGFYEELEMDLMAVRLTGTVDGETFDVLVPVDMELEMEFDPPVKVTGSEPFNVTVSVDPIAWLDNGDGTYIDPRDLGTDATLMNTVRQRMALSFDAFGDTDFDADSEDSDTDSR